MTADTRLVFLAAKADTSRGLAYLLLGIIVGTGLWLGWSGPLRISCQYR